MRMMGAGKMKKIILCMFMILLLSLFGCGSQTDTEKTEESQETKTEEIPKAATANNDQEQRILDFFAAWNNGDSTAMETLVFQGYGYTDIAGDITTVKNVTVSAIEDISKDEGAAEGEKIYKVTFSAAFTDNGKASGFINGENNVKLLLLYDDEQMEWLITQWEKC